MRDDIKLRGEQRAKYFEKEGYPKWSALISQDNSLYDDYRERVFLTFYLTNSYNSEISKLESALDKNLETNEFSWQAIFNYLDERLATTSDALRGEVNEVAKFLEPYREKAKCSRYDAF